MSNDVDPQSSGPQPNPFDDVRSDGSPRQPFDTSGVEPSGTTAQPGPLPEYFSAASGAPLPPVVEAFPGYRGVPQPPKKLAKKVVGSRVIRSPTGVGIGVAGIVVILVVAVITVLLTHRRGSNPGPAAAPPAAPSGALPPSPSPPTFTRPDQLNGILLSVAEISVIMDASDTEASQTSKYLDREPPTLSNPDCVGAFDPVQVAVYADSGKTAVRVQRIYAAHEASHQVTQAAVMFPSADEASRFVQDSAGKWKNCANQTVTQTVAMGYTLEWTFASLNGKPPAITLKRTLVNHFTSCQHALSAVSNVVIDVQACGDHITNEGGQIADKMVAKVKGAIAR